MNWSILEPPETLEREAMPTMAKHTLETISVVSTQFSHLISALHLLDHLDKVHHHLSFDIGHLGTEYSVHVPSSWCATWSTVALRVFDVEWRQRKDEKLSVLKISSVAETSNKSEPILVMSVQYVCTVCMYVSNLCTVQSGKAARKMLLPLWLGKPRELKLECFCYVYRIGA